jgi:hypothetical protein
VKKHSFYFFLKNAKKLLTIAKKYIIIKSQIRKVGDKVFTLKEETKRLLSLYKLKSVASEIGINYTTLSDMIKRDKPCMKLTAYAIAKLLDGNKEILDYFDRKED